MLHEKSFAAIDTETTGLRLHHGAQAFAVSIYTSDEKEYWFEWGVIPSTKSQPARVHVVNADRKRIIDIALSYDVFTMHNAKFDMRALHRSGIDLTKYWDRCHCTLLMSHVLDSQESHELKTLALKYLDMLDDDQKALGKAVQHARSVYYKTIGEKVSEQVDWQEQFYLPRVLDRKSTICKDYGMKDAKRAAGLFYVFSRELSGDKQLMQNYEREQKLQRVVYDMEECGMSLNPRILSREKKAFTQLRDKLLTRMQTVGKKYGMPDFNPASNKQLPALLYDKNKLGLKKQVKYRKGKEDPSVTCDKSALINIWIHSLGNLCDEDGANREAITERSVRSHFVNDLLSWRAAKTASDYLGQYSDSAKKEIAYVQHGSATSRPMLTQSAIEHILHGSLNQVGPATTRFSSSDPNLQNVSKRAELPLRCVFGPRRDTFWYDIDYSNLELRIFAHIAQEQALLDAFKLGHSVHMLIAKELWGVSKLDKEDIRYKRTKNGTFAIIYGAGEARYNATVGLKGGYNKLRKTFKGLDSAIKNAQAEAKKDGYVTTLLGYRLYCREPHAALNYKIQGTAGDIMKYGMLNVDSFLRQQGIHNLVRPLLTVHDELIVEVPDSLRKEKYVLHGITKAMEEPATRIGIETPVEVDIVRDKWSVRKEIKIA